MNKEDQAKLIAYWLETAAHDFETMESLFASKRYDAALFFGHIVLEKAFKALVVERTGDHAPYTHDLTRLAALAGRDSSEEELSFLETVNTFNMEARYPEEKLAFYKQCTYEYTEPYKKNITDFYQEICREMKQQRQ